ncbi:MAG: hypothetical protein JSR37_05180 [Verrucomicrobia bacterium]|nr:hypothetical protein [Verrucomicrobiota bacterium]MBS0636918.1 hypothetical protein [Verrucomicrobiota bacterium]
MSQVVTALLYDDGYERKALTKFFEETILSEVRLSRATVSLAVYRLYQIYNDPNGNGFEGDVSLIKNKMKKVFGKVVQTLSHVPPFLSAHYLKVSSCIIGEIEANYAKYSRFYVDVTTMPGNVHAPLASALRVMSYKVSFATVREISGMILLEICHPKSPQVAPKKMIDLPKQK